jgi:hypothetical protein
VVHRTAAHGSGVLLRASVVNSNDKNIVSRAASQTFSLQAFDANCGLQGYNCRSAFQQAFAAIAQAGGGTLELPAGTFEIDFPEIPENVNSGPPLASSSLIVVSPNTLIEGQVSPTGTYESVIQWSNTSIPTFIFASSSGSGMRDLHIQFTGTMPTAWPYFDSQMEQALGYNNQAGEQGGPYELSSFAYVFNSDDCTFDHLSFDSETHDNNHIFIIGINMKGKGIIENNGGGFSELANGNSITNIQLADFNHGFLVAGQHNLLVENITADHRGSDPDLPPGHVLYTTALKKYETVGTTTVQTNIQSTNVTIQNITEGPDTYSNIVAMGTLATKFIDGGIVNDIHSQHPLGLDQTIQAVQNVTFSNMTW